MAGKRGLCFSMKIVTEKIQKTYKTQAKGWQESMVLFNAPSASKKYKAELYQGSTYHLSLVFFYATTARER